MISWVSGVFLEESVVVAGVVLLLILGHRAYRELDMLVSRKEVVM